MTKEERIRYLKGLLKCELCEEESTKICNSCDNRRIGSSAKCYDALEEVIKALEQESTTKNDLAVECIVDILGGYTDLDIPYKRKIADDILTKLSSITPQATKSEWQQDHEILKAYSDGANDVLDKIRAEIESKREEVSKKDSEDAQLRAYCFGLNDGLKDARDILDKYQSESEG